jgi:glutamate--cysteine ligase
VDSLHKAINTPFPDYQALGVKRNGQYQQLNSNVLQIENEYYSSIRPKRITFSGEKPVTALGKRGVEYIEVRCIDINPFESAGLGITDARFLDIFLLGCALADSPPLSPGECKKINHNFTTTVTQGRRPQVELLTRHGRRSLAAVGLALLRDLQPIAKLLDGVHQSLDYSESLACQAVKLQNPAMTPSGRIMTALKSDNLEFIDFALANARQGKQQMAARPLPRQKILEKLSAQSLLDQQRLEQNDTLSFDAFLQAYFNAG